MKAVSVVEGISQFPTSAWILMKVGSWDLVCLLG